MTSTLPDLWLDWCAVTGTPVGRRDQATLDQFSRQASPSHALLGTLRPRETEEHVASAWPAELRADSTSLERLVRHGSARIENPATHWVTRLRLRRLLFAATLLAPVGHGGLGLTRTEALGLTPRGLQDLRPQIRQTPDEPACPACAVWSWLDVLGTNGTWTHRSVRALAHQRDEPAGSTHRHQRNDPSPGWADWPDHPGLLPCIDQWGYISRHASMHPSSLSAVVRTVTTMVESSPPAYVPATPVRRSPTRYVTPEEEAAILARADELNARITRILNEYG
ncbi:hypothetical protein C8K30_101997 [Promicromonospora sp. AC04]|uniref:hypothetical protein n=1 Tax=Promicromonospora sp. AC04 TaxID=2135723 RepID=UPI000D4778A4|nr:hypothetical protein [Promicromonospora sp. AC04]PUB32471.1 hypothetical protein C8K30_101997 [Promicromonospora sp. AC04]